VPGRRVGDHREAGSVFVLLLLAGLALAAVGGDRFVRGAVGLATWLRVPAGIVGATVAAFATSSPELTVGVISGLEGRSELAFGDAAGSNMVNLGVVLGLTLLVVVLGVGWGELRRDVLTFVAAIVVVAATSLDGRISRLDASVLLAMFVAWLVWVVVEARRQRIDASFLGDAEHRSVVVDVVLGLVLLVVAGRFIVVAGKEIGESLGWSEFVVGTVIVAIGTSTPELVTTVIAARRGHVEVGVGAIVGSNIFNSLFIVGVAGVISPIVIDRSATVVALVASLVATGLIVPGSRRVLGRARGSLLLATYGSFILGLLLVAER